MSLLAKVRVYTVGDLDEHVAAYEAPQQPVAVHRLPSKMSSIAWSPDSEVCTGLLGLVIDAVVLVSLFCSSTFQTSEYMCKSIALCVRLCVACTRSLHHFLVLLLFLSYFAHSLGHLSEGFRVHVGNECI